MRITGRTIPHVIGGRPVEPAPHVPYVDADNRLGAEMAAKHLLSRGCTRIATITGPMDMSAGIDRLAGFRAGLGDHFDPALVETGDFTEPGGQAGATRLLERVPDIDALFAASDLMALGALAVLRRTGRRVPTDVAVMGFDDNSFAIAADPPLTTIRQDPMNQGRAMVRLYLEINRKDIKVPRESGVPDLAGLEHLQLPVSLVVRDSA